VLSDGVGGAVLDGVELVVAAAIGRGFVEGVGWLSVPVVAFIAG
jgi:hypothetical protein